MKKEGKAKEFKPQLLTEIPDYEGVFIEENYRDGKKKSAFMQKIFAMNTIDTIRWICI